MAPPTKTNSKFRPSKITTQTLLDFDLEESSSDSDFRIEDHDESDDDFSDNSNAVDSGKDDDDEDNSDSGDDSSDGFSNFKASLVENGEPSAKKSASGNDIKTVLETAKKISIKDMLPPNPICCACLGDRSDDTNEIVECDGCGVSVHEGCYGVSESTSVSSTVSSCSTEPWFCEACKAGIVEPTCELCPNTGGIFKETDVGRWVHLICALYVPGVAFGEVDQLSSVTLFEMPYSKWGAKTCSLCEDAKFARTGVCIGCDAGMCKTYFHVTCAQAAGFLSEAHSEEADHADPFYAHCKVHSDKTMIKHRKRNFNTLKLRMEQKKLEKSTHKEEKPSAEQIRIQRKLTKHQTKYRSNKTLKTEPWVPTQKMPRLLTTSATACKRLIVKAELMGIDTAAMEFQEAQMAALADVRKKWHIPPAFSVEFIGYYLDRISRLKNLKSSLERNADANKKLLDEQQTLRDEYDKVMKVHSGRTEKNTTLKDKIAELHKQILSLCPTKSLPEVTNIGQPAAVQSPQPSAPSGRPMSVPTAAALKMGVGFPLTNLPGTKDDTGRILSTQRSGNDELVHACGICKRCNDQHMLAKCDTCHFYYHLGCLNPPLTRHPKKSKLYGWQCSECDKSDDSDAVVDMPKGPRKSRTRLSKDGTIVPYDANLSTSSNDGNSFSKSSEPLIKLKRTAEKTISKDKQIQMNSSSEEPSGTHESKASKMKSSLHSNNADTVENPLTPTRKMENVSLKQEKMDADRTQSPHPSKVRYPKTADMPTEKHSAVENDVSIRKETKQKSSKKIRKDKGELTKTHAEKSAYGSEESFAKSSKLPEEHIPLKVAKLSDEPAAAKENSTLSVEAVKNFSKANQNESSAANEPPESKNTIGIGDLQHKQSRKRRKEKHKNKYPSDSEKSPTKEHKRKRKKKSHDMENPNDSIPKIRIKFKTLPLPGEIAPEPQCFYVSADMVRPQDTSRPTSVETVDDSTMNADDVSLNFSLGEEKDLNVSGRKIGPSSLHDPSKTSTPVTHKAGRLPSPRKSGKRISTGLAAGDGKSSTSDCSICDVCKAEGTNQNLVKCDECQKNYHFTCLDPPLKKTPKKRGYSWHCADCDPTDVEGEKPKK